MEVTSIRYAFFPKEWGEQLKFRGRVKPLEEDDLDRLEQLRERFYRKKGELLSWKFDLEPLGLPGLQSTMKRLWGHGYVVKFARSRNTLSDRPQYIQWYIWGD